MCVCGRKRIQKKNQDQYHIIINMKRSYFDDILYDLKRGKKTFVPLVIISFYFIYFLKVIIWSSLIERCSQQLDSRLKGVVAIPWRSDIFVDSRKDVQGHDFRLLRKMPSLSLSLCVSSASLSKLTKSS